MTQAEFHARAWKLANDKARELVDRLAKPSKGDANACGRRDIRRKNDEPKRGSP
jgi:hypothetical protein